MKQYRIVRDGRLLALTPSLYYTDNSVKVGQTYTYVVKAMDAANNMSLDSNSVVVTPSGICESTQVYFKQNVETSMGTCASCHVAGGMGQNSRFILSNAPDSSLRNLGAVSTLNQTLGKQIILDKASGKITHGVVRSLRLTPTTIPTSVSYSISLKRPDNVPIYPTAMSLL